MPAESTQVPFRKAAVELIRRTTGTQRQDDEMCLLYDDNQAVDQDWISEIADSPNCPDFSHPATMTGFLIQLDRLDTLMAADPLVTDDIRRAALATNTLVMPHLPAKNDSNHYDIDVIDCIRAWMRLLQPTYAAWKAACQGLTDEMASEYQCSCQGGDKDKSWDDYVAPNDSLWGRGRGSHGG